MRVVTKTATLLTSTEAGDVVTRTWRLEVAKGPDAGRQVERASGTLLVGTHPDNDLALTDTGISRYHLELRLFGEGVEVRDLGSKNGTRLGDARIERAFARPGTRIRLGRTTLSLSALDEPLEVDRTDRLGAFVTRSEKMSRLLGELALAAESTVTIVLEGETGTGKELLARGIHERSSRADGPYVVIDCSIIQESLLSSQLFGHREGAFTGAVSDRVGAFERAHAGTVFLDEIGELPLSLQPKLLRVLESRTVMRLGEDDERSVDVRFVAATNRSLARMVEERRFRADLYHRLAVVRTRIPPLRERPEDVELLARRFAGALNTDIEIGSETVALLESYDWPGNGRELRNVIERAAVLARGGRLEPRHLFPEEQPEESYDEALRRFEQRYVKGLLARHGGVVSRAAKAAGLSRGGLYKVMRRADVES